ncbi:hypothetical protein LXL04_015027 [Taraxacum kok-saghyz]
MLRGTCLILKQHAKLSSSKDSNRPRFFGNFLRTLQWSRIRVFRCFSIQMLLGRCLTGVSLKFSVSKHSKRPKSSGNSSMAPWLSCRKQRG